MGGRCRSNTAPPAAPSTRREGHADASPVAWRYRTHDVELLRREERLRYVLNKVYGAWRVMMLSEVSLPEETRCIGIAAAEPTVRVPKSKIALGATK